MRLAVMYIWVSRDVGHMIDSGSGSVSTVRDLSLEKRSPDKSNPKCSNCSARAAPGVSRSHYALTPDCPMMALQRNIVIEGTYLVSSKSFLWTVGSDLQSRLT